jgi:hypothetical protein
MLILFDRDASPRWKTLLPARCPHRVLRWALIGRKRKLVYRPIGILPPLGLEDLKRYPTNNS